MIWIWTENIKPNFIQFHLDLYQIQTKNQTFISISAELHPYTLLFINENLGSLRDIR